MAVVIGATITDFILGSGALVETFGITTAVAINTALGAAVIIGVSYGVNAALAPGMPSPAQQKQVIKQAVGPRLRFYGENKVGGTWAFLASKSSNLYQVIMLNGGEIDSFVSHYLGEDVVTLDGSGEVTDPAIYTDKPYAQIIEALGTDDQTAFSLLTTAFPGEWTTDHRLRGVACVCVRLLSPPAKDFSAIYPSGIPTYNGVIKASKVWDPRDVGQDPDDKTTWAYT